MNVYRVLFVDLCLVYTVLFLDKIVAACYCYYYMYTGLVHLAGNNHTVYIHALT